MKFNAEGLDGMIWTEEADPKPAITVRNCRPFAGESTQEKWKSWYATQKSDYKLASAGECYEHFKQILLMDDSSRKARINLINALLEESIITGTTIHKAPGINKILVEHDYLEDAESHCIEFGEDLIRRRADNVVSYYNWYSYLKCIFKTTDGPRQIFETISKVTGVNWANIYLSRENEAKDYPSPIVLCLKNGSDKKLYIKPVQKTWLGHSIGVEI